MNKKRKKETKVLFTAYPDGSEKTVTLTIIGDEHGTVKKPQLVIPQGSTWNGIKALLTDLVTLSNENIELTGWKQEASDPAPFIDDDFVFTTDSDIYASTQITSFITDGNGTITGYEGVPTSIIIPTKIGSQKVTTIGTFAFKENPTLTAIDFSTTTHLTILGKKSFIRCFQLKGEVKLPASLEQIGNRAFAICTQLAKVDFSRCTHLTTIGSGAFENCTAATGTLDLTRCKKLTAIKDRAFANCEQLEKVDFSLCDHLSVIEENAFRGCVGVAGVLDLTKFEKPMIIKEGTFSKTSYHTIRFPASMKTIPSQAFKNCEQLTEIDFSLCTHLKTIETEAFTGCTGLTGFLDLSGLKKLTTIEEDAFSKTNYTTVRFPASMKEIGGFEECTQLAEIDFSCCTNLTTIGEGAFYGCTELTGTLDLTGFKKLTTIEEGAFSKSNYTIVRFPASMKTIASFRECTQLTEIDFSRCTNLTTIGEGAFYGCTGLTGTLDLTGFKKLTTIERGVFSKTNYTTVRFPASIKTISGFWACSQLTKIDLSRSANLTTIGEAAFYEATGLAGTLDLTEFTKLTTIEEDAFSKTNYTTVRLPASMKEVGGFYFCSQLTEMDLSRCVNLTTIEKWTFYDCTGLTGTLDLTCFKKLTTIGYGAFSKTNYTTVRFPASLQEIEGYREKEKGATTSLCKKVLISATPVEEFNRIKVLVVSSGYPEDRIESY